MAELLLRQKLIAEAIEKININFKKDSSSRKTPAYAERRLNDLRDLWNEFEQNHDWLMDQEDKSDTYFVTNAYAGVKQLYDKLCEDLEYYKSGESNEKGGFSKSDELIRQQTTNFRAFTRMIRNLDLDELTEKWEIEDKLHLLQSRWKVIDDTHWQIDNLLIGSDVDYEEDYAKHEQTFESTKRQLNRKLNSTSHQQRAIPPIEIPIFSGNYHQWPTFMDLYMEAIHTNSMLSKTQKMQHLKGRLRGEAERIVQHLTVSAENYDTCWDLLKHRYNNVQLLFTKQIQTFINQPSIQQQTSYEIKRLHDTSLETIHAIHNLGVDTTSWDPILVHIVTGKLDSETYATYMETRKAPRELPSFDEMIRFLESKFTALEPVNKKKQHPSTSRQNQPPNKHTENPNDHNVPTYNNRFKKYSAKSYHVNIDKNCPLCKTNHYLAYCDTFLNMNPDIKLQTMDKLDICKNCMYSHNGQECKSKKRCRACNSTHHTILHDTIRLISDNSTECKVIPLPTTKTTPPPQRNTNHVAGNYNEVLLATIQLKILAADGTYMKFRCLLDQGSQINLITEAAAQRLGLSRRNHNATVTGIGTTANQSNGTVKLTCLSLYNDYSFATDALVMAKMLNNLPNYSFDKQDWPHLHSINLADPEYNISRNVDIILDAGVYADIVMDGILKGPPHTPMAQQTKMGWVLLGNMKTFNCHVILNNLEDISSFWEMEEISETHNNNKMTSEHEHCETLYRTTTRRLQDGRYEVRIPMLPNFETNLGASKPQAIAQFYHLEKKLANDEQLSRSYKNFIQEYLSLDHMKLCTSNIEPSCILPHHGVLKPDSTTTKLRVVFNASAKTKSGYSLNQLMECGPNLQQDLQSMILRWRTFPYVYTADIEKFYRQIRIQEEDQHLQKILWRDTQSEPIKEYQLSTITYGTKAAPYLAMRTIKQLVSDDGHNYPLAANILTHQLYMDDLLGGSNTIPEAREAQQQLINILKGGGFNLRKWASSNPELLQDLPENIISQNMLDFKHAETNKTLGLTWNPRTDNFTFRHALLTYSSDVITKRALLSNISRLYDPIGWLSPVTMKAKLIFQQAWRETADWDDVLPVSVEKEWQQFSSELNCIHNISIPRWLGNTQSLEIHGFSDASEKAYGCAVYCRTMNKNGDNVIELVAGKTKLAPLRKPITLPRLELCGALLLSQLIKKIIESVNVQTVTVYGWTDSMVVLGWIQGDPCRWQTFVSNRVVKITEVVPPSNWRYVKSEDNPADCASRGLMPSQLQGHSLWWQGPNWLKNNISQGHEVFETNEETKKQKRVYSNLTTPTLILELLDRYNSMSRVTRVLSWILRFVNNARDVKAASRTSYLTTADLEPAHIAIIKTVQHKYYADIIAQLRSKNRIPSNCNVRNLNPYIDNSGILRVGGRLGNTDLNESQKHPIILPNNDKLTVLIIDQAHKRTLHGGARLTLSQLRNKYWIIGGMRTVKKQLLRCVTCHRFKTSNDYQLMADLPRPRVTPSRPFTHTGVDFTGQVEVKANKGRGIKTMKGYIAVFICLCTKAIHLELVSDLSTPAFLAALKRFCARRGTPANIYSDNGTNFVGAAKSLAKERKEALQLYINSNFIEEISEIGIQWHFNAPAWPTAGGIWEAAVKSMKYHLKRVLGEQKLTFEEFVTLLSGIEACLNSRPLVALTDDIEDLNVLTPGHFLVGGPVLSPPLSPEDKEKCPRTRWQLTEKMNRDFWKRWSADYLQTLQTRSKWHFPSKNIEIGNVVLLKEDNIPPARWLLGKVTETHPGGDGRVRVVTVKTKTNYLKRPITKLSRLPIDLEEPPAPETNQNKNTYLPKRNLRPRHSKCKKSYLCTLLWLTMCIASAVTQTLNVTQLNPSRLVYFDKTADLQLIQDEWKMVVFYNMTMYWNSLTSVENYIDHLNNICQKETFRICNQEPALLSIISQFKHDVNELNHYNNILSLHSRRIKRGFVNVVGNVANTFFGILDDKFAERYDKDIKLLQNNENHLLQLYKEQTSIIEGEHNLLKRNEQVMNQQFNIISKHIQETEAEIRADTQNTIYITTSALAANMVVANLRRVQQSLLDLITDVRNGHVDTHLLKPDDFETQLNIIAGQVPKGLSLPCVNSRGCIQEMYKLSRVHVKLTNDFIIFEVKIPLVSSEQYELNRVIPIHNIRKEIMTTLVLTHDYLAINLRKNLLITLTFEEITSCSHISKHQLICNIHRPIYDIKTTDSICEAQIINNSPTLNCETKESSCKDDWVELQTQGSWLFTCCNECNIRLFCPTGITSQTLRDTGIVTLPTDCMLRGDHHVINAHHKFRSEVHIKEDEFYIPESGVNHFLHVYKNFSLHVETHDDQINSLHTKIQMIKDQQTALNLQYEAPNVHHYLTYSLICLTIILGVCWAIFKFRQQRKQNPTEGQYVRSSLNVDQLDEGCSRVREEIEMQPHKPRCLKAQLVTSSRTVDKATSPITGRNN